MHQVFDRGRGMTSPQAAGHSRHPNRRARTTLLIVEDNRDMRELYETYFVAKGFGVETASDGRQGFDSAIQRSPDLVVTDLSMPHVDGWEMIRRLKNDLRTAHIPIIACTGQILGGSAERALDAGCDAYVLKPCLPEALLRETRRVLANHPSQRRTA
jgi:two-component system, cell cycle response regulator DivK